MWTSCAADKFLLIGLKLMADEAGKISLQQKKQHLHEEMKLPCIG